MNKIINGITEVTNNHYRELKYDIDGIPYFTYKSECYSFDEIIKTSDECLHDGYIGFSYFNGLYIDLNKNNDCVKITYFH